MMQMSRSRISLLCVALSLPILGSGCAQVLAVEVLPPRTGTCQAPGVTSNASGRGLLDAAATETMHGSFVGDLRIAATGNMLIDGISLAFTVPEDAGGGVDDAASEAEGEQPLGDLLLTGEEDDVRQAVVEDVELLPRALAVALFDDSDLDLSATEWATVVVQLTATSGGDAVSGATGTFRIDVCEGCLTTRPADEDCDNGVQENDVCRPGQQDILFECADPPSGGLF